MFEDGITDRELTLTGEALHRSCCTRPANQEETQDFKGCEVADEPVVVMKFRPVKPGNRVEGKT